MWASRDLSLLGKIHIVKSIGLSQLVYVMSMLPNPSEEYFKDVENIMFRFIWGFKDCKIKRMALIGDYDFGGAKMTYVKGMNRN